MFTDDICYTHVIPIVDKIFALGAINQIALLSWFFCTQLPQV